MKVEKIKVTEFVEEESIFSSTGTSSVKVTKAGKVVCLEIPIRSTGISELIDSFQDSAPSPPMANILVKPDDPMGKEMKLTEKKWMKIPDLTDANYIKQKREHDSDLGVQIVLKGIDVDIKDKDGKIVTDETKKIEIMKKMGLSGDQFSQIVEDVTSLTQWSEVERENFLG